MDEVTPQAALAGGALIGLAASLLLLGAGRVAGISGIATHLLIGPKGGRGWRAAFVFGLLVAGFGFAMLAPAAIGDPPRSLGSIALAGLIVGVGTRIGGGCTSGHGVCGVSRLSRRSLVATLTFVITGAVTLVVLRWLGVAA